MNLLIEDLSSFCIKDLNSWGVIQVTPTHVYVQLSVFPPISLFSIGTITICMNLFLDKFKRGRSFSKICKPRKERGLLWRIWNPLIFIYIYKQLTFSDIINMNEKMYIYIYMYIHTYVNMEGNTMGGEVLEKEHPFINSVMNFNIIVIIRTVWDLLETQFVDKPHWLEEEVIFIGN